MHTIASKTASILKNPATRLTQHSNATLSVASRQIWHNITTKDDVSMSSLVVNLNRSLNNIGKLIFIPIKAINPIIVASSWIKENLPTCIFMVAMCDAPDRRNTNDQRIIIHNRILSGTKFLKHLMLFFSIFNISQDIQHSFPHGVF